MAMKRCPVCGEEYSETYRNCPFCEEAMAMEEGRPVHRRGGRRSAPQRGPNILTPVLIVVILVLALLLGYLFFGSAIREKLGGGAGSSEPPQSSVSSGASSGAASSIDPGVVQEPDVSAPDGPNAGTEPEGGAGLTAEDAAKLPATLTLSLKDFTPTVGDPPIQLSVKGGGSGYTWLSEDDGVVSVDETGKVTFISAGTVKVYATDGAAQGSCIVRVRPGANAPAAPTTPTAPTTPVDDGKTPKLNREDFTLPVGQTWQLTISGITTAVTWASKDSSVATVSSNGTVTAVAKGTTTVTATYDNTTLSCIVRVS